MNRFSAEKTYLCIIKMRKPFFIITVLLALMASSVGCRPGASSQAERMRRELLQAQALNQSDSLFTSDSVLRDVVRYYDRHGSANDRLLAHYLLGCVYRDLGEAPKALASYQDAIDCADTTDTDCDYKTLSRVYSQMAEQYGRQLLYSKKIESLWQCARYSMLIHDTIVSLLCRDYIGSAYIMLNQWNDAESILLENQKIYDKYGFHSQKLSSSCLLIHIYVRDGKHLQEAKRLIDSIDNNNAWSHYGENSPFKKRYYSYKGRYYEQIGELDSAEYYIRKAFRPHMSYKAKDPVYRGLLKVFAQRHQADSMAKYALLYCEANDSSIAIQDHELTARMGAQYNYDRAQRIAAQQKEEAERALRMMWMFISIAIVLTISIAALWFRFRKNRRAFYEALDNYHQKLNQLNLLETSHKIVIELVSKDLKASKDETDKYHKELEEAQREIAEFSTIHKQSVMQLEEEIARQKQIINELRRKSEIAANLKKADNFKACEIVTWISHQARKNKFDITDYDKKILVKEFATCYPTLYDDLHTSGVKQNGILVCILVLLKFREKDIASFLHLKRTGISNIKSEVNLALFNEKSSRSLFKNLEMRYGYFY